MLSALCSSLLTGIDILVRHSLGKGGRRLGPTWRRLRFSGWNILLLHTFYYLLLTSSSGSRGCLPMIFLPTFFIQELSPDPYRGDLMNTIKKLTILWIKKVGRSLRGRTKPGLRAGLFRFFSRIKILLGANSKENLFFFDEWRHKINEINIFDWS